jgi:hypothetical protein
MTGARGAASHRYRGTGMTNDYEPMVEDEKLFKKMAKNARFRTQNPFTKRNLHLDEESLELWPKLLATLTARRGQTPGIPQ